MVAAMSFSEIGAAIKIKKQVAANHRMRTRKARQGGLKLRTDKAN